MLALEDVLNSSGYFYWTIVCPCTSQSSSGWWRTQRTRESSLFWLHMGHRGARWNCQALIVQKQMTFKWDADFTPLALLQPTPLPLTPQSILETTLNTLSTTQRWLKVVARHQNSPWIRVIQQNITPQVTAKKRYLFLLRSTRWRSFRLYPSQLSVNTAKGELAQI